MYLLCMKHYTYFEGEEKSAGSEQSWQELVSSHFRQFCTTHTVKDGREVQKNELICLDL